MKRLRDWFYNHGRRTGSSAGRTKVLDLTGRKKRHLSGWHAFYHLYYETELREVVLKRWKADPAYTEDEEEPPFEFRNEVIIELWKKASDEVKERVAAYIQEEYEQDDNEEDAEYVGKEEEEGLTPEEEARRRELRQLQT